MKPKIVAFLLLLCAALMSCQKNADDLQESFDYMCYESAGGVFIFKLMPTDDSKKLSVVVTKYMSRDTTILLTLDVDSSNVVSFTTFTMLLNNQVPIESGFVEDENVASRMSMANLRFVGKNKCKYVVGDSLRSVLMVLKNQVHQHILLSEVAVDDF